MENIQNFLDNATKIRNKHILENEKTGKQFNVFEITHINNKELPVCMFIHELINPKGSHFQEGKFLQSFCDVVLNYQFDLDTCNAAKVTREKIITNDRRIDLYIEIADKKIPIEVKIKAEDQSDQCFDYLNYAENTNLFYLTLFGDNPSEKSVKDKIDNVTCISFKNHILDWIVSCKEYTKNLLPINEVLNQFEVSVRKLVGLEDNNMVNDVKQLILNSSENVKSAFLINQALQSAKIELITTILSELEHKLSEKFERIYEAEYSYDDKKYYRTKTFYESKNKCPGVDFYFKSTGLEDVDIWLRIEIEDRLFWGFCVAKNKKWSDSKILKDRVKILIPNIDLKMKDDSWWLYWEYLLNDDLTKTPDFRSFNDTYFKLFDREYRGIFINDCIEQILKVVSVVEN